MNHLIKQNALGTADALIRHLTLSIDLVQNHLPEHQDGEELTEYVERINSHNGTIQEHLEIQLDALLEGLFTQIIQETAAQEVSSKQPTN